MCRSNDDGSDFNTGYNWDSNLETQSTVYIKKKTSLDKNKKKSYDNNNLEKEKKIDY